MSQLKHQRSGSSQIRKLANQITTTAKSKPNVEAFEEPMLEKIDPDHLIPTGSTLLNCACSDNPTGGYGLGKIVNIIGDSSSGKSLLALTCFAEMATHSRFDDYRLIYDDVEAALEFNVNYLFGGEVGSRIETNVVSDTVQDFYGNILKAIKNGRPFIYILDSLDALTSKEEIDRTKQYTQESKPGQKETGSYKTEKAKMISEILRVTARDIKTKEALVLVVSQTRDNLGFGFSTKTRSGGKALKFFSCHEMWLGIREPFKKKDRIIGVKSNAKVTKNKLTGKVREVDIPIYYDYGIDDIGANIDFLVSEQHWKKTKQTIEASEFDMSGTRDTLIRNMEHYSHEKKLQKLVGTVWGKIEEELRLNRKRRY
jgi:recombination protein RecA